MAKAKKIKKDQLKKIQDQQNQLNEILRSIGVLEVQKMNLNQKVMDVNVLIEATKSELEKEYGSVNIDLTDGSYTDIKENAE
tara:strand:+ start:347 stop:592 length:246 start_codon:yes stop_codon:yes gene_type:complete